jgi:hypothetical protein
MIIKTVRGTTHNIDYNASESFSDLCDKIKNDIDLDDDVDIRLVCMGAIINESNFVEKLDDDSTVICTILKRSRVSNAVHNKPTEATVPVDETPNTTDNTTNNTDTTDNTSNYETMNLIERFPLDYMKAYTIVFLSFMKNNPDVMNTFNRDFGSYVYEIKNNPAFDDIMTNIINNLDQITEAYNGNGNIRINVGSPNDIDNVEITSQDMENINMLIEMGFEHHHVIRCYRESNGDINETLSKLQKE